MILRIPRRTTALMIATAVVVACVVVALTRFSSSRTKLIYQDAARVVEAASTEPGVNPFLPPGQVDRGWSQVRGPSYNGRSPEIGLAESWAAAGPPVLWTRRLGQGYSGYTAIGSRVFTQIQTLSGQFVACLHADTGETLWEHRYDWPFEPAGLYPGPRSTPTYSDGFVYFTGTNGLVGCLSAEQGKLIWSVNVKQKYREQDTGFGYSISPTVEEGKVILPVSGTGASLVALDVRDGSVVWASGDAKASYTPALPITLNGERQLIALLENTLAGFELGSGRQLWSVDLSHGYDEHSAWPLYAEPYLMICGPFRSGSTLYHLSSGAEPKRVRQSTLLSNDIFSSLLIDGQVYGFDLKDVQAKAHRPSRGVFRCLDFQTGEKRWETDRVGHATVLEADGKLILFNDRGELILARASPEEYRELGRVPILTGEICWTQPTLYRGRLYVRNQSQAACLYLGAAALRPGSTTLVPTTAADIPQTRYFDLAMILGVEPEYAFDLPSQEWLRDWYLAGLLILGAAGAVTAVVKRLFRRMEMTTSWWLFWGVAFMLGAAGTTLLSLARSEFTFTWPVCVFVAFEATVYQNGWGRRGLLTRPLLQSYATAGLFVLLCLGYFLLCRRLSLVTEWAFLAGFPAALPCTLLASYLAQGRHRAVVAIAGTVLSFTAYYWGSVALLAWKY